MDAATDKAREIDIIAERVYNIERWHTQQVDRAIVVRLYIECKYIVQDVVFWFDDLDVEHAMACINKKVFTANNYDTQSHHYLAKPRSVAKLLASAQARNEENDPMFRALNQCLNGRIYHNRRTLTVDTKQFTILTSLHYPVIMCSGFEKFHRVEVTAQPSKPLRIIESFLLDVHVGR